MTDLEIRPLTPEDDMDAQVDLGERAFGPMSPAQRAGDATAAIDARGFPAGVSVTVPLAINDHARPANSGHWELTVSEGKGILIPNGPGILGTASYPAPGAEPGGVVTRAALTLGARGLAALYAGTPVAALRLAGLASGGSPETDASLDAAFAAAPYMVDDF